MTNSLYINCKVNVDLPGPDLPVPPDPTMTILYKGFFDDICPDQLQLRKKNILKKL